MAGNTEKPKREGRLKRFFRETSGELRRVSWPTWPEARRMTYIVIVVMVIMAFFLWMVDVGANFVLAKLIGI
ncbi:MAG: preprotein translocase subunit SecE [Anaerolineales bacterium]|nr:preprotein translocase subunit SecE [Anaerolineales bacterium]